MITDELLKTPWFIENATIVAENEEYLADEETVAMMKKVVDLLQKKVVEYKKMSDNPSELMFK